MIDDYYLTDWCEEPSVFFPPVACEIFAAGKIVDNAKLGRLGKKYKLDIGMHDLSDISRTVMKFYMSVAENILYISKETTEKILNKK
jgi:hypothetical protein